MGSINHQTFSEPSILMLVMVPGAKDTKVEIGLRCCLLIQVQEYGYL